jgi:hypothetical protein
VWVMVIQFQVWNFTAWKMNDKVSRFQKALFFPARFNAHSDYI